ncbi:hypothetical protein GCM10010402_14210 [Actinomadura luteofluorescens]
MFAEARAKVDEIRAGRASVAACARAAAECTWWKVCRSQRRQEIIRLWRNLPGRRRVHA